MSKNKILNASMAIFYRDLRDESNFKSVLDILSRSLEYQKLIQNAKITFSEWDEYTQLVKTKLGANDKKKLQQDPTSQKILLLLNGHLNRIFASGPLEKVQQQVVVTAVNLTMGLLQIAVSRNWLNASATILQVSQHLLQAIPFKQSPLLQLPHISLDLLKHFNTKKRSVQDIDDFIKLTRLEQEALLKSLAPEQVNQVIQASLKYPQVTVVNWEYAVLGEPAIIPGAIVTLSVKLGSYYGDAKDFDPEIPDSEEEKKDKKWWENDADKESDAFAPYYPSVIWLM